MWSELMKAIAMEIGFVKDFGKYYQYSVIIVNILITALMEFNLWYLNTK